MSDLLHYKKSICFSIKSKTSAILELISFLKKEMELDYFVELPIREALKNAVEHGNQGDVEKEVQVKVTWRFIEERETACFSLYIKDMGEGFEYTQVQDPTLAETRLQERGRGLHFMKQFATKVEFLEKGNHVRLCFPCPKEKLLA